MCDPARTHLSVHIRPARTGDVAGITSCVREAYRGYVERIGRPPAPMLEDYAAVVARGEAHVAIESEEVVGVLVVIVTDEGFCLDNVAVRTRVRGKGVGRALLGFAESEALRRGFDSICLYTNELMTENRSLYRRVGYVEYDRRVVDGYSRLFFRKMLGGASADASPSP